MTLSSEETDGKHDSREQEKVKTDHAVRNYSLSVHMFSFSVSRFIRNV